MNIVKYNKNNNEKYSNNNVLKNIVNKGKEFGKNIKKHGVRVGASLLLPFVFSSNVNALDNPGLLNLENHLNNSSRSVNIERDDVFYPGAQDGSGDGYDTVAQNKPEGTAQCYSDAENINTGEISHLWSDVRPNDSNAPYDIKFSYQGTLNESKENKVKFDMPWDGFKFGSKPIIFQQTSSKNDPTGENEFYPVYDVRKVIENGGEIVLKDVPAGTYDQWTPYASGRLDIGSRRLSDLNDDGIVNFKDYQIMGDEFGKTGEYISDIAGPNGVPDGTVDYKDLKTFTDEWLKETE